MTSRHRKEAEEHIYQFLTPSLENGGWSAIRPGLLQPGRRHVTNCTGEMTQHYNSNLRKTHLNNSRMREKSS